jgi:hypothetical protein
LLLLASLATSALPEELTGRMQHFVSVYKELK